MVTGLVCPWICEVWCSVHRRIHVAVVAHTAVWTTRMVEYHSHLDGCLVVDVGVQMLFQEAFARAHEDRTGAGDL